MRVLPVIPIPEESYVRRILSMPYDISFAGGLPDPVLLDKVIKPKIEEIKKDQVDSKLLSYGATSGLRGLREKIAQIETDRQGMPFTAENVLITTGSQQGIELSIQVYATGKQLIMEMPSYLGAIPAAQYYLGVSNILPVDIDERGIRTDLLEERLASNPNVSAIYIIPNGHNPAGVRLETERRIRIMELARRHNVMVIEDDPYYGTGENPLLNIIGHDPSLDNTLLLRTFSKELCNFRVGYVLAHQDLVKDLGKIKSFKDLHTSLMDQWQILRLIQEMEKEFGSYGGYLNEVVVQHYRPKRELMGESIQQHFGNVPGFIYNMPKEGLFYWAQFPKGVDTEKLFQLASTRFGLVFVPGVAFDPLFIPPQNNQGNLTNSAYVSPISHCARLNFSCPSPSEIQKGMKDLRKAYDLLENQKTK